MSRPGLANTPGACRHEINLSNRPETEKNMQFHQKEQLKHMSFFFFLFLSRSLLLNSRVTPSKALKSEAVGKERDGLIWFPTDRVLHEDAAFRVHFEDFARSQAAFFEAYKQAHKRLSELGSAFAFELEV